MTTTFDGRDVSRRRTTPAIERLMRRVEIEASGCWIYQGAKNADGYGTIARGRRGESMLLAHVVSYEHHVGAVPEGLELDHTCRNRACCNPDHLDPVTHDENVSRGNSPGATAVRLGVCKRGHSLDEAYVRPDGKGRDCRTCRNERRRTLTFSTGAAS